MVGGKNITEQAKEYIRSHKKELCLKFADITKFPSISNPSAYFMAGSPGAGKTEYSKSFINELLVAEPNRKIVRIDADEVRDWLPTDLYDHTNADSVQGAAALGVEKLLDCVFDHNQDFLLDATFSNYELSYKNITRCIKHSRKIGIVYLYQDPLLAWDFTVKREKLEGRKVPKSVFINSFFSAKDNVNRIKQEFGKQIELTLVKKNFEQRVEKIYFNILNIDPYLKISYNKDQLQEQLK